MPYLDIPDSFEGLVDRSAGPSACHIWLGRRHRMGYGVWRACKKDVLAHRAACAAAHGPSLGRHALHSCANKMCVNPTHLRWGSHQDNMDDRVRHYEQERVKFVEG